MTIVRPTGLPGYDRKIIGVIQQWRFAPSTPACTIVTFVYSQRGEPTVIRN